MNIRRGDIMNAETLLTIVVTINSTWSVAIISLLFKHERRLTNLENKINDICAAIRKMGGGKNED